MYCDHGPMFIPRGLCKWDVLQNAPSPRARMGTAKPNPLPSCQGMCLSGPQTADLLCFGSNRREKLASGFSQASGLVSFWGGGSEQAPSHQQCFPPRTISCASAVASPLQSPAGKQIECRACVKRPEVDQLESTTHPSDQYRSGCRCAGNAFLCAGGRDFPECFLELFHNYSPAPVMKPVRAVCGSTYTPPN